MFQPLIAKFSLKGLLAILMVGGSLGLIGMLGSGVVPKDNHDFFEMALSAWITLTTLAVKRVFDGTDSSDQKNQTIDNLTSAVHTAMKLPAAE